MQPIVTIVAWFVCVCVGHNCESDKTAELIEVPFGISSWIDPRNYVSARSPEMGNFFLTHCEVLWICSVWQQWCGLLLSLLQQFVLSLRVPVRHADSHITGSSLSWKKWHTMMVPTTTTNPPTVLRPLYRLTCIGWHLQLRTGGFVGAEFYCLHASLTTTSVFRWERRCWSSQHCYLHCLHTFSRMMVVLK